ncbi:VOC family protein [Glycomyces salinus]|uniref:VOC family protein n=1 Tax=Glycomyces salinus TaxID=980294 RepID=UPI0018EBBEFA|nr:VOC family protein [Glycomyces salinus]
MLQLTDFIIDCPDPKELAAFYAELTGEPFKEDMPDQWTSIRIGGVDLAFYRVEDYRPPSWPDDEHPKQFHLDFEVDEFEPERRRIVELGATHQRDFIYDTGYGWQVYTDPVGHPFCLCRNKGATWSSGRLVQP